MGIWSYIHIEGFCLYSISNKKKTIRISNKNNDIEELINGINNTKKIVDNDMYIDAKRPKWCLDKYKNGKRVPCFSCLSHDDNHKDDRCVFFAFCEADKEDIEKFKKAI